MKRKNRVALAAWVDAVRDGVTPRGGQRWGNYHSEGKLAIGAEAVLWDGAIIARRQGQRVIFALPTMRTAFIQRGLRELLEQRGVTHFTIPTDVLDRARIAYSTITIIDTTKAGYWPDGYAPQTLIKAETETRWAYRSDRESSLRTAYFLSGFDHDDLLGGYFFCELPPGAEPTTVAEAYEALKPEAVREAERMGKKAKRQGDIFAVPVPTFQPTEKVMRDSFVLHTNHLLDEVVQEGGITYARGKMHHTPSGRRRDHMTVRLGKTWHIIIKNTVPLSG